MKLALSLFGLVLLLQSHFASAAAEPAVTELPRLPRTNLLVFHRRDGTVAPVSSKSDWQMRRQEILVLPS